MSPTVFYGLTSLGVFHTLVSLLALAAGAIALIRDKKIVRSNPIGRVYLISTVIVCFTGFGIFQHDGFGKPHALGVITLITIVVAFLAGSPGRFGRFTPYVERIGYSLTFFFHIVPTITESATRLPYGVPLAASPEDPRIKAAIGVCFLFFLAGAFLQARALRRELEAA